MLTSYQLGMWAIDSGMEVFYRNIGACPFSPKKFNEYENVRFQNGAIDRENYVNDSELYGI